MWQMLEKVRNIDLCGWHTVEGRQHGWVDGVVKCRRYLSIVESDLSVVRIACGPAHAANAETRKTDKPDKNET
jgi:hypothetical protein